MKEIITRIDNWIRENRYEYYQALNEGLSEREIEDWEDKFGFKFTKAFKMLYQWKNGQSDSNREYFFDHVFFDPIELVYDQWEFGNDELTEFNEEGEIAWGESWLRFMTQLDDNGYCLDVEGDLEEPGNIVFFVHNDVNEVIFPDLKTMMKMIVTQFEQGVYGYEEVEGKKEFVIVDQAKADELFDKYAV